MARAGRGGERRRAREFALQLLFQIDLSRDSAEGVEEACGQFWESRRVPDAVREFSTSLVRGAHRHREFLDGILAGTAHHWKVSRMAVVDRNILRIALYEFLFHPETPPIVVIDEAIEIAKRFGNDESGVFVNGILDAVRLRIEAGEIRAPGPAPTGNG